MKPRINFETSTVRELKGPLNLGDLDDIALAREQKEKQLPNELYPIEQMIRSKMPSAKEFDVLEERIDWSRVTVRKISDKDYSIEDMKRWAKLFSDGDIGLMGSNRKEYYNYLMEVKRYQS